MLQQSDIICKQEPGNAGILPACARDARAPRFYKAVRVAICVLRVFVVNVISRMWYHRRYPFRCDESAISDRSIVRVKRRTRGSRNTRMKIVIRV